MAMDRLISRLRRLDLSHSVSLETDDGLGEMVVEDIVGGGFGG